MKNSPCRVHVPHKTSNLVISRCFFRRGQQRNVPQHKTHVQSDCLCSLNRFVALSLPSPSCFRKVPNTSYFIQRLGDRLSTFIAIFSCFTNLKLCLRRIYYHQFLCSRCHGMHTCNLHHFLSDEPGWELSLTSFPALLCTSCNMVGFELIYWLVLGYLER